MREHHSGRDAAPLPVVHALGDSLVIVQTYAADKRAVAAGAFDQRSSLCSVHAREFKHGVKNMSNAVFNRTGNELFTIGPVVNPKTSRSLAVVRRLMEAHRLNRSGFARAIDVTAGAVTNWFRRGEVPVTAHRKIIDRFGVSADDLIERAAPAPTSVPVLMQRSAEAAQLAAEWDKIRDPFIRDQIRAMIEAAVKSQIDIERKKPAKDGPRQRLT